MLTLRRVTRACALALAASQWLTAAGHAQAPDKNIATALHAGVLVEREIAPGAPHRYDLALAAGQFADLTITDNITLRNAAPPEVLEVTLRGSSGDTIQRVARETAANGARRVSVVADHADVYAVTIAATSPLRYTLRVAGVRAATDADRRRSQALADFVEAERLRGQHSTSSDRESISRYAAAASQWTQAGDRQEAAHAWHRLALVDAAVSDWENALDADEHAAALGRELGDLRIEASALNGIGITQLRLGDFPAALREFERALVLFAEAGDRDSEAYTLSGIGVIYQSMGDADKALQYFPRAMANWKAVGNREGEALGLHDTGTALRLAGRFEEAMPVLEESLRLRRALGHPVFVAATLAQIGHTYLSLSDVGRAFKAYEEALAIQRKIGERRVDGEGNAALGDVAQRGDWPAMIALFSAGASIFQASAEKAFEARILHAPAVRVRAKPEDLRRGINVLMAARPFLRATSSGRWGAVVDTAVANIFIALGEPDRALDIYPEALATFRAIHDRDGEAAALGGLALAETFAGRIVDARDHAAAALRVVESFQADVANQELRALYISGNRAIYALYIALEMELEARNPGRGHQLAALLASERARARGLLDLLHTARLKITAGVDAQLLARERQLTSAVEQAHERLTRLLTAKAKPDAVQVAERELDVLIAELSDLQRQLQVQSPRYAALTQPPALDVAGIQRLLDADSVLLEYSLGTIRSYVWVVTPDAVTSAVLPGRADIEQAARRAYDLIARGARRDTKLQTQRALESLSDLVLAPVAPLLTRRRVIIVPDAGLHYVPFAALPKPHPSRASSSAEPLIVHHEVVMLPSASALDALRNMDRSQAPAPREVAVFADPVLRRDDPRLLVAAAARPRAGTRAATAHSMPPPDDALMSLDRLPFTRAEANAIASLTPGDRTLKALDFSASRATALAELGSARIVHFATHALINSEQPDRSGIVLSLVDRDGAAVDGFLKLHDIYNLQLNADLVVLSACRTALGKELRGEGLIGLTRGFFYAGAPAVVASLWDVRDRSTAELMTRFYRAMLQDHLAPAAALRAAQVSMLRDPRWSAPAHWAGFILRGDWLSR